MSSPLFLERDRDVVLRDGTVLRADVWRAVDGPPAPVLLQRTPYDKGELLVAAHHAGLDPLRAVTAGWAVVIADVRGRHASEGVFAPFAHEIADAADVVDWLREQPWCDGRVCTYGTSYCGLTSLAAGVAAPAGLVAVAAAETASPEHWTTQGGAVLESFLTTWARADLAPPQAARRHAAGLAGADTDLLVPELAGWLSGVRPGRFALEGVTVPTLLVAGWHDRFLEGQLDAFAARDGQHLLVGPWAHGVTGSRVGSLDYGAAASQAAVDLTAAQLAFFTAAMAGETGTIPLVRLFVMGADRWREEDAWPPARSSPVRLHLHPGDATAPRRGTLDVASPTSEAPPSEFVHDPRDPVPTAGGPVVVPSAYGIAGPADQAAVEGRPDVLVYTSRPLAGPVELIGTIRARLSVASTAAASDWAVKLVDVHPDGRPLSVTDGVIRAATSVDGPVEVRVGSTALRLAPGHRLRVEVAGANHPRFAVQPEAARQVVFHHAERPSWIELPVASGVLA